MVTVLDYWHRDRDKDVIYSCFILIKTSLDFMKQKKMRNRKIQRDYWVTIISKYGVYYFTCQLSKFVKKNLNIWTNHLEN